MRFAAALLAASGLAVGLAACGGQAHAPAPMDGGGGSPGAAGTGGATGGTTGSAGNAGSGGAGGDDAGAGGRGGSMVGAGGRGGSAIAGTGGGGSGGASSGGGGSGTGGGTANFTAVAPCNLESSYSTSGNTIGFGSTTFRFEPSCLKVPAGATVTFNGDFVGHPLAASELRGTTTGNPIRFTSTGTTASFVFPTPGFYAYLCLFHGTDDGFFMSGVVWVQ